MKVLNRGYVIVSPKSIFFNELTPQANNDYLVSEEPEPSVYLIEENFWDDETVLKKYYKRIVHSEMSQLETKDTHLLGKIKFENIHEYFKITMGSLVFDLDERSLERITVD